MDGQTARFGKEMNGELKREREKEEGADRQGSSKNGEKDTSRGKNASKREKGDPKQSPAPKQI